MDKESEKMWKQIQNKLLDIKSLSIDRYEVLLDKAEQLQAENERLKAENDILRQYKNSKQASYENMQRCWQESEKARRKLEKENTELKAKSERLKFKLDTVEADYEASEIEIEDLKNKLNLLTTANNHLLELDKYRQKELENKAEATKSNIHNLALLSKANKTLQEIKTIAECDCGYCKNYRCPRMDNILDLITKAEEE